MMNAGIAFREFLEQNDGIIGDRILNFEGISNVG